MSTASQDFGWLLGAQAGISVWESIAKPNTMPDVLHAKKQSFVIAKSFKSSAKLGFYFFADMYVCAFFGILLAKYLKKVLTHRRLSWWEGLSQG